jgi:putative GTP pyrophosphokinase
MAEPEYSKRAVNRAGERLRASSRGSVRPLDGPELDAAREIVEHWRGLHAVPLSKVAAGLRYYVRKAGADERSVSQRLKRFDTIVEKLDRHPGTLSQMEDIGGVRAVLPEQAVVDAIVVSLKRRWNVRRLREYIDGREPGPKSDGYRAVHVIVVKDDRFIEIQLRTRWQDRWAQAVERDTRRLGEPLKFGGGADDLRTYYRLVAEQMAATAAGRSVPIEVLDEISRLYHRTAHYYDSDDNGS